MANIFRWIFGDFMCKAYASLGFIFGLASIYSFALILAEFYMLTVNCKISSNFHEINSATFIKTDESIFQGYHQGKSVKIRGLAHLKWICAQWAICLLFTYPPLFEFLGRFGLEPAGTSCTIDYWHGNFKYYRFYILLLVTLGFMVPMTGM